MALKLAQEIKSGAHISCAAYGLLKSRSVDVGPFAEEEASGTVDYIFRSVSQAQQIVIVHYLIEIIPMGQRSVFLLLPSGKGKAADCDAIGDALSVLCHDWRRFDGFWVLISDETSDAIRDQLLAHSCLAKQRLLVVSAGHDAAWAGYSATETDWLVERL